MLRWVWAGEGWPARYQNACPRPRMPWSPPPWSPPGRRGRPRGVPPPYHCHHRPWTLPCQRHRRWTESPSSSLRLSGSHYVHRPRSRPLCNRNRRGTSPRPADRTVTKPTHQNPPPSSSSSFLFLPRHYPLKDLEWIGTTCSRLSSLFFHLVENPSLIKKNGLLRFTDCFTTEGFERNDCHCYPLSISFSTNFSQRFLLIRWWSMLVEQEDRSLPRFGWGSMGEAN